MKNLFFEISLWDQEYYCLETLFEDERKVCFFERMGKCIVRVDKFFKSKYFSMKQMHKYIKKIDENFFSTIFS